MVYIYTVCTLFKSVLYTQCAAVYYNVYGCTNLVAVKSCEHCTMIFCVHCTSVNCTQECVQLENVSLPRFSSKSSQTQSITIRTIRYKKKIFNSFLPMLNFKFILAIMNLPPHPLTYSQFQFHNSLSLSIFLSICLSIYLSIYYFSIYLSIYLYIYCT